MSIAVRGLVPALLIAVVMSAVAPPPAAHAGQAPSTPEAKLLSLINDARSGSGKVPLRWDRRLGDVAQERSDYQARTGTMKHLEWSKLIAMIEAEGIVWYRLGETLTLNKASSALDSAGPAFTSWRNSSAHWDLLTSVDFNYIAIAVARSSSGWYYWTALLLKGPDRTAPGAELAGAKVGPGSGGARDVTVSWTGRDVQLSVLTSGLRDFKLQRRLAGGTWKTVGDWTTATSRTFSLDTSRTYEFRVRARDKAGNIGKWSPRLTVNP